MTLRLEHVLIPAHDQEAGARFLAGLLGLEVTGESSGSSSMRTSPLSGLETSRSTTRR